MDAEVNKEVPGKVKFGMVGLNHPTPMWAVWSFRIVFLLTSAVSVWLASTGFVSDAVKVEAFLVMKGLDVFVWGIGRFLGVKKSDFES